jgi:hypothetical protein
MVLLRSFLRSQTVCFTLLTVFAAARCSAQEIKLHLTYVCNGEHIYIDSCNMRDTSDSSTCMVMHSDHINANGIATASYETRATLKKLLPTCTQPSAASVAAEAAFQKKQQQIIDAQTPHYAPTKAITAEDVQAELASGGSKDPQELAMRRCIAAGRLPSSCTGNALLGAFGNMIGSALSGVTGAAANASNAPPDAGPTMSGVFQGAGSWRLDFVDGGVLVNCSFLSPNEETYSLAFRSAGAVLTIDTKPRPLALNVHADGTITGPPGAVTIDGVIASGYNTGLHNAAGQQVTASQAMNSSQPVYNDSGQQVTNPSAVNGYSTFSSRRATCPAVNLTSQGAGVGIQTMQMNLLKTAFGGDTGPATPAGIRMHGIFAAASTGFSLQFFPESVILGCGPMAARAYPYTVSATASGGLIRIEAADHPLSVAIRSDGSLDPGSGPYPVHGRMLVGQTVSDSYTFLPLERTCNLAALTPARDIPATGGAAPPTHP